MRQLRYILLFASALSYIPFPLAIWPQESSGTIAGTVTDVDKGALPGAKILLQPGSVATASNGQGNFTFSGVRPGDYKATFSYVGFEPFTTEITVAPGKSATVNAVLNVTSKKEQVMVTSQQLHGETEAINVERTTPQIVSVLPSDVIMSLPNANIADAVGRLPSVTLERDEGEGKYMQVRGTEPRLSNLTIDGVELPSPEAGVRQIKLDTIPADLVQSVQVFKTLEADQPGDAIGGAVNLQTRTAGDQPVLSLFGMGGVTPIVNTVPVYEFGATAGKRFGRNKQLGLIGSFSWDYNGRGIDDLEPVPAILPGTAFTPGFSSMDFREYMYDRTRYGFGVNADYHLGQASTIYVHTLYSNFKDFGNRYDYAISTNEAIPGPNVPSFTTQRRIADFGIAALLLGGNHTAGEWTLQWQASVARSRELNPAGGGTSNTDFNYLGSGSNCQYNPSANKSIYRPQLTGACYAEAYNPANYALADIQQSDHGLSAQLNLQGSASAGRAYTAGSHPGVLQTGFYFSNAHKFDNSYQDIYTPAGTILMSNFVNGFKNANYYGGAYPFGPGVSWSGVNAFLAANPAAFTLKSTYGGNPNNFDLIERIYAGYLMNTIQLGRFTLIGGLRIESTLDNTLSFDNTLGTLSVKGNNSYVNLLPDVSLITRLDSNSDVRLAYGRGLSRPVPQFLTAATSVDTTTFPPTVSIGNPALKPELANNYDVLYERYLKPVGLIRGGFFYKLLASPIVSLLSQPTTGPYAGYQVNQAANAGSAHLYGFEASFEQHFTYLPGLLHGLGLMANYSHAASRAYNVNPGSRTDIPALLRTSPNAWNISPTYDRGRLSIRVGLAYNGPSIDQYNYVDGNAGGLAGPGGDVYLFSHFQVDAQGSYRLGKGFEVVASALNLNNEPFGFYQGSPKFFIQREYYDATYTFGFRWNLPRDER